MLKAIVLNVLLLIAIVLAVHFAADIYKLDDVSMGAGIVAGMAVVWGMRGIDLLCEI